MVGGDTTSNEKMIGDHTVGLGFLKNAAVDQHLLRRNQPVAGANGRFYFLGAGDRFDMKERTATRRGDDWYPLQGVRPPG